MKMNWKRRVVKLQQEARVLYFVFKHPRTRWHVRCVAVGPVVYFFSPIQLIPNFVPLIGFLDDFLVLLAGSKLIRKLTPPDLLLECCAQANAAQNDNEKGQDAMMKVSGTAWS